MRYVSATFATLLTGDIHFFMLDSDENEPDGRGPGSTQAAWLRGALNASAAPFKVRA